MPGKLKLTTADIGALIEARHPEPRSVLGYHEVRRGKAEARSVVRVLEPDAAEVAVEWPEGDAGPTTLRLIHEAGLFEGEVPRLRPLQPYRLRIHYRNGATLTKHDPYFFAPQLSEFDLHLFGEGNHHHIYYKLGAHPQEVDGV